MTWLKEQGIAPEIMMVATSEGRHLDILGKVKYTMSQGWFVMEIIPGKCQLLDMLSKL